MTSASRWYHLHVRSPTELAPTLDIDARLTEIERGLNLLLNVTPINAAEAWVDFERGDFATVPTLRLRPLEFEPDLVLTWASGTPASPARRSVGAQGACS